MSKSYRKMVWGGVVVSLLLAACAAPAAPSAGGPLQAVGEGEGRVDIVAWAGYIERGDTDPAFDWVTDFEAQTGCMVQVKTAATSDEMVALMTEGGFDVVTASGDASNRLISGGKLQEINIDLIPSWDTVDDRLKEAPWHFVDGKHYGVPYQWGSNVLMYSTEAITTPPTSWSLVFEETTLDDGQSNSGRIEAYDGAIYIADAALYLMYHNPELGHQRSLRPDPRSVQRRPRPAAAAADPDQPLLARRLHPDG